MTCGVFVGLSTIDLVHTVDEFPPANTKAVAHGQAILVGGPATNAAITFSHLGGDATLIAGVGRHTVAALVKEELQRHAIEFIDLAPDFEEAPPISSVWVNRHGQRSVVSVNTTRFKIPAPQVDQLILEKARILMVDGHSMEACQAWTAAAQAHGVLVVFDGGSWKPGTELLLKSVDVAICSADFRPPECTREDDTIQFLQAAGVRQIAITRGAGPVRFADGSNAGLVEVPQVDVIDTTGAGDIFHGAFCFHIAAGLNFVDALHQAAIIASESCRFHGTREWMQSGSRSRN